MHVHYTQSIRLEAREKRYACVFRLDACDTQPDNSYMSVGVDKAGKAGSAQDVRKGPRAVIVSPSRELAGQIRRALNLLAKGTGLTSVVLKPSSAAGTDFSKVILA